MLLLTSPIIPGISLLHEVYAAIFVAMSRVADKDHIRRLLENTSSAFSRKSLYEYLADITPDENIAPFFMVLQ